MFEKELEVMKKAGIGAIPGILKIYHQDFKVEIKDDNSPVTLADKNADKYIRKILHKAFPNYALLTEEEIDDKSRLDNDYVFIVDPVDGTKDFVDKDDQFTTNIALAYKHEVVAGVVVVPATGELYFASKGKGAFYQDCEGNIKQIHVSNKLNNLTVLTSKHHVTQKELDTIEKYKDKMLPPKRYGSSLKACKIAQGEAEITYRMSDGTKEWDTAAFQIIVEEAGGLVLKLNDKKPITYNREDVYNREGYIVINRIENFLI